MIFSSYFSELSKNQLPQLCCKTNSKTPNTHLFCALNGNWEEKSWKAVGEKTSVSHPSGREWGESLQRSCVCAAAKAPLWGPSTGVGRCSENKRGGELHGEQSQGMSF